ncbi:HET-domain-containing protein, partial [Cadophora sp. DSE1049]
LPTRLIDCGSGPNPKCQLVLSSELPGETEYTTLSYCWGTIRNFLLLHENIMNIFQGIPIDTLPKTLQDAILTTRKLGARYLWIDSLSIIQDDPEDWKREPSNMFNIYGGSYCNISATVDKDSVSELLRPRNPFPFQQLKVQFKIAGQKQPHYLINNEIWKSEIDGSPLSDRGWVCQERFLSPCILHFRNRLLFWECGELAANECKLYPGLFDTILEDYTSRRLTYAKDKLVAIAGLARLWGLINKDEYLAGLWRADLATQLLWYCKMLRIEHLGREYTAPSWSWAALDGSITRSAPRINFTVADGYIAI